MISDFPLLGMKIKKLVFLIFRASLFASSHLQTLQSSLLTIFCILSRLAPSPVRTWEVHRRDVFATSAYHVIHQVASQHHGWDLEQVYIFRRSDDS